MIIDYTPQLPIETIITKKVCGYNSDLYIGKYEIVGVYMAKCYRYTECEPVTWYKLKPLDDKAKLDIANKYTYNSMLGELLDCTSDEIISVIS